MFTGMYGAGVSVYSVAVILEEYAARCGMGMSPGAPRLSSVDPLTGLADASKVIAGEESHIIIKRVIYVLYGW